MNRTDLSFLKGFVSCGLQTVKMMLRLSCYFQTYTRFTVCILSILNGDVFHANDLLLVSPCCLPFLKKVLLLIYDMNKIYFKMIKLI